MIELRGDRLVFSFPQVHPRARFTVGFQRTLRIPDDGREYPLPAGLGWFPLRHVDDHADTVPASWLERGGVILPMHQAEAMWLSFDADYPMAVKVAAGKINAVSGKGWSTRLHGPKAPPPGYRARAARHQDYLVLPEQPWLDGFNVATGQIRQFVAMPLGGGHTAEEQLTGRADVGGIQLLAYPLKADRYTEAELYRGGIELGMVLAAAPPPDMGLGLGGLMRQDIEADPHGTTAWDLEHPARCFIHLANAQQWQAITGEPMPTAPITPAQYAAHGIPWFDYAAPGPKAPGSATLAGLKTVAEVEADAGRTFSDDGPIPIDRITRLPSGPQHVSIKRDPWTDPHTGLPNIRAMERRFAMDDDSRATSGRVDALVFLDLDQFRSLNHVRGWRAGDEALRVVAEELRQNLRDGDACFRSGGDEFLIVLPNTSLVDALALAERLRAAVAAAGIPHGSHPDVPILTATVAASEVRPTDDSPTVFERLARSVFDAQDGGAPTAS
jgi:diguanylate cyclase (GGDEF)-like protein